MIVVVNSRSIKKSLITDYKLLEKKDLFKCPDCEFTTSRKDSLLRHQGLKHGSFRKDFDAIDETLKDSDNSTCSKCNKTFTNEAEIERHVISCKEKKCKFCDKKFTLRSNFKRHIEKQHPVCTNCNERFKNAKRLKKHRKNCMKSN